jgi:hypothetical protein
MSPRDLMRLLYERFGVRPEFSRPLLPVLERMAEGDPSPEEWESLLRGIGEAWRACERVQVDARDEVAVLMRDFLSELKKIDESLKVLGAYVDRIRMRLQHPSARLLH